MILIQKYKRENKKSIDAQYQCEKCMKFVDMRIAIHDRKVKNNHINCATCNAENGMTKRKNNIKKPNFKNGIKILEHIYFNKGEKRYAKVECPLCKEHYIKRWDQFNSHPLCKHCGQKKAAESRIIHGLSNDKLFKRWEGMITRCHWKTNENNITYYQNKGITVCKEWQNDFKTFYDWALSNGYHDDLELDKDILCDAQNISPKIYSPKTCMWITKERNVDYARTSKT